MTDTQTKKFKPTESLSVVMHGKKVGELTWTRQGAYFTYIKEWLASGFNLSPLSMSFDEKPQLPSDSLFDGIHGPFADSLPDGWGLLLMDRFFERQFGAGVRLNLTQLDRLAYLGNRGMGAFEYYPMTEKIEREVVTLSELYEASVQVQTGMTNEILDALRIAGGSPGGARPKAAVALSTDLSYAISAYGGIPDGYAHWIVKFRSVNEPWSTGAIEYAYSLMAKSAGVDMAESALLPVLSKEGGDERFFATKRFDRNHEKKVHMMTAAGLIYANFRTPCLDYKALLRLTWRLTNNALEVEKMARLMIFNGLAHNYDDHAKNFSFLYDENQDEGQWRLAPAYDLTFSSGMGEHTTAFNGAGRPTRKDIKVLCSEYRFLKSDDYIDQTLAALAGRQSLFEALNIKISDGKEIFDALKDIQEQL